MSNHFKDFSNSNDNNDDSIIDEIIKSYIDESDERDESDKWDESDECDKCDECDEYDECDGCDESDESDECNECDKCESEIKCNNDLNQIKIGKTKEEYEIIMNCDGSGYFLYIKKWFTFYKFTLQILLKCNIKFMYFAWKYL